MKTHNLSIELSKQKHLHIWLIPVFFAGIIFLWECWGHRRTGSIGYTYTLYQVPLLNSLVMPLMISVLASRCCDMEWQGDTLKQLCTLQRKGQFYDNKFLHETLYLMLFVALECLMIPLCGTIFAYSDVLTPLALLQHGAVTAVTGLTVLTLQHFFSLTLRNQIVSLFMGLAGSFLGLFAQYLPGSISRWILWSYFAGFLTSRMHWDRDTRDMWFTPVPFPLLKFLLFALFGMILYLSCRAVFLRKEV